MVVTMFVIMVVIMFVIMFVIIVVTMFVIMYVIMVVIMVVTMLVVVMEIVWISIKDNVYFSPGDAFPLILCYFQFITRKIQLAELVNQEFRINSQVDHRPKVHIPTDA